MSDTNTSKLILNHIVSLTEEIKDQNISVHYGVAIVITEKFLFNDITIRGTSGDDTGQDRGEASTCA